MTQAVLMLLKSFVGTGVLFLGKAFANGGLVFSTMLWFPCMRFCYWFRRNSLFADIGGALYGPLMRYAILSSIAVSQLGFVSAYTIFVAENLKIHIFVSFDEALNQSVLFFILVQLVIFLPLALVRNLAKLSTAALVADVFIFAGLLCMFGSELAIIGERGMAEIQLFNPRDFPLFIGTAVFSFEGVGLIFPYVNQFLVDLRISEPERVGFYSGIAESAYSLAQLFSVYQWGRISDIVGRRPVVFTGLIDIAVATLAFGLSTTFAGIVASRFVGGLVSANVAVIHSILAEITDDTNQDLAVPIYSLAWSLGTVILPLIGGTFANAATQYPGYFSWLIFVEHPYLPPCLVSAACAIVGVVLGHFHINEKMMLTPLRALLLRTYAIQRCQYQPGVDKVIPIYFKSVNPGPGGADCSDLTSANDRSTESSTVPIPTPPDTLGPLAEEHDSASLQDEDTESRIGIALGDPDAMKATMTDVQKAIEQLGRSDRDGSQSFSFASTRDGDTDRDTDGTETDGEIGEGWHRSARDKLAQQARKVVEAQAAEEAQDHLVRTRAPPIDVEMSDDSEVEEDDSPFQHLQYMHSTRDHPHIPEEEEGEEARRISSPSNHSRKISNELASVVLNGDLSSSPEQELEDRAPPPFRRSYASSSSPPRSTYSPIPSGGRSPNSLRLAPNAINIVSPIPIVPVGVSIIPVSVSPVPVARGTPTPSISRDSPAALPSPGLSVSGVRQHSRQTSQRNSVSSGGRASARTSAQSVPEAEAPKNSTPPSEWTVDEVVEWLKSKGFASDVYDKFIEQEITGDVLLELDISLLKAEIGIAAFGKRMRIANAIAELRRPSSIMLGDSQQQQAQSITHPISQFTYGYSPSGSTHHSPSSPMFVSIGSTLNGNGPPSSTLAGFDSPRTDTFVTSPLIPKRVSSLSSTGAASLNGGGSIESGSMATGIERAGLIGVAGLGLEVLPETQLLSPNESGRSAREDKADEGGIAEDDRGALSESESTPASVKLSSRRRLFGRSGDSSSLRDKERSVTPNDSKGPSPTGTGSPRIKRRDSKEDPNAAASCARGSKRNAEVNKGTERHSLFGGISSSIGRSRKPPPRITSTLLEESSPTEKSSTLGLSRLYSSRKTSSASARPSTAEGSVMGSFRSGNWVSPESDAKKKEVERARSIDKSRDPEKVSTEVQEYGVPPRKQTLTPQAGSKGPSALKPGKSIVEQIGKPDHEGWMRKKGDHYNTWKTRYFIIKGPHLYVLRSNSKAETKIKGYVNIVGYKVIADENVDPGRYGFRIVHETDKTHFFSSEEQAIVREWMKAIMKATIGRDYSKPVVSSVNIPTIPLTVAQAMNPAPRPPSPTARAAMQKALRRENPNQLSSRDARVLMGLPSENGMRIDDGQDSNSNSDRVRLDSLFIQPEEAGENGYASAAARNPRNAPPRPSREPRRSSVSSQNLLDMATDGNLVDWANSHLPRSLQMADHSGSLFGGLAILRLAEDMMGKSVSPPIPDSAFPSGPKDDKLDGLFRLFDFLLDNDIKMGDVSINDVRQGKRDRVMHLLRALKSWEDRRKEIVKSVAQGTVSSGPFAIPSW